MAARPNTFRTLTYGRNIAKAHVKRLEKAIAQATTALADNKLLLPAQVEAYKSAIKVAKQQVAAFTKIVNIDFDVLDTAGPKRGPGRPRKSEVAQVAAARGGKAKVKAASVTTADAADKSAAPKRRGRPPKNLGAAVAAASTALSAPVAQPKRRGRPPKNPVAATTGTSEQSASPAPAQPKRRGRPPKNPVANAQPNTATTMSVAQQAVAAVAAQPKRRGRPPKDKAKIMNGQNLSIN